MQTVITVEEVEELSRGMFDPKVSRGTNPLVRFERENLDARITGS